MFTESSANESSRSPDTEIIIILWNGQQAALSGKNATHASPLQDTSAKKDSFIIYTVRLKRSVQKVENLASSRCPVCVRQTADLHFKGCSDKQPCVRV